MFHSKFTVFHLCTVYFEETSLQITGGLPRLLVDGRPPVICLPYFIGQEGEKRATDVSGAGRAGKSPWFLSSCHSPRKGGVANFTLTQVFLFLS